MTDTEKLAEFLSFIRPAGDLFEIRVFNKGISSGLFNNPAIAAREVAAAVERWPAATFYYTLNSVDPESEFGRSTVHNSRIVAGAKKTTADADIPIRCNYLIDVDPVRVRNTCSTAGERLAAREVTKEVRAHLTSAGWPTPTLVSSGNGYHLIYRADGCPADTAHLNTGLGYLARMFNTDAIKIDTSVSNASRISRLPWTWNRKGTNTPERPHRMAKVLGDFGSLATVSEDHLIALVGDSLEEPGEEIPSHKIERIGLRQGKLETTRANLGPTCMLDQAGVQVLIDEYPEHLKLSKIQRNGASTLFSLASCPFKGAPHHGQEIGSGKTAIIWRPGSLGLKCFSDDCSTQTIGSLLRLLYSETGRRPSCTIWRDDFDFDAAFDAMGVEDVDDSEARTRSEGLSADEALAFLAAIKAEHPASQDHWLI